MRKIYSLVLMATMLLVGTNAWAADVPVNGTTGSDLQAAVNAANSGDRLILQHPIIITQGQPIWLGTTGTDGAYKSVEIDLNGNNITCTGEKKTITIGTKTYTNVTCPVYMFVLSHGELKLTNSSATQALIKQDGVATEATQLISVYGTYAVKKEGGVYTNTWADGYFSHLVVGQNVKIIGNIGTGIGVDVIYKNTGSASNNGSLSVHPLMQASNNTVNYITNIFYGYADRPTYTTRYRYEGSDASGGYGYAYGVKIDVYGEVDLTGTKKTYGIKVNGMVETATKAINSDKNKVLRKETKNAVLAKPTYPEEGTVISDPSAYAYVASYTELTTDTACAPFIHVHNTALIQSAANVKKSTAIYSSGWAKWLVEGTCIGATGINIKSGKLYIKDATIASNADSYTSATDAGGASGTGSGIVVNSTTAYSGDVSVTISGDTKVTGSEGYAIEEIVNTKEKEQPNPDYDPEDPESPETITVKETKVDNIVITGGTFDGNEDKGAIIVSEETASNTENPVVVYGGNVNGTTQVGTDGDLTDLIPTSGYHTTEVTNTDGSKTIVVSPGDAPTGDANVAAGHDKNSSVKWTGATETISANLELKELEINESTTQTLTIAEGKTLTVGRIVMGVNAQIIVKPTAKLIVNGEQGIVAPVVTNLILEANNTTQGTMLFNPAVSSNRQPYATVQFTTAARQIDESNYVWQRLTSPLAEVTAVTYTLGTITPYSGSFFTALCNWDYVHNTWASVSSLLQMKAFEGYALTNNANQAGVRYNFKGRIQGTISDDLVFKANGWNFFGNAYTGSMHVIAMLSNLENAKVEQTAYVWNVEDGMFEAVNSTALNAGTTNLDTIPALQTVVFRISEANPSEMSVKMNYKKSVWEWGTKTGDFAPGSEAPLRTISNLNSVRISVMAEDGTVDRVTLIENDSYSSEYESGADAEKLMNEDHINFYALTDVAQAIVATDDMNGTVLSLQTLNDVNYTMSFDKVNGEVYALRDNLTNAIVLMNEGATYNFMAQSNTTLDGRFQIVSRQEMPTAVETVEETIAPKAIYTIMGQYVGETTDWNTLPAGVYVVDGVKIVK